ncbi:hypothetical protein [Mesonia sp. K7]|uniref:hypothetical protein n=1 Tax=Mesonia sp. K7 TaxID=2218606 RepID=UPI000DA8C963|nr:hypothetical protein [Mesonia sp. K7]PZD78648.1 hypothetical protein DNG35_04115 [Mesonia sp. K7]
MKKLAFTLAVATLAIFTSCREEEKKEVEVVKEVEVIEKEVPVEVEKEDKGILERTAEKIDAEVEKEVNEEIEKIGNDN